MQDAISFLQAKEFNLSDCGSSFRTR